MSPGRVGGPPGGSEGALSRTQEAAPTGSGRAGLCLMEGAAGAETEPVSEPQAARDPVRAASQGEDLEMKLETQSSYLHGCAH